MLLHRLCGQPSVHGGCRGAAAAYRRHGNAATRRDAPADGGPKRRGGAVTAVAAADVATAATREATRPSPVPRQRHDADAADAVRQTPTRERRCQHGNEEEVTASRWGGGRLRARPQQFFEQKEPSERKITTKFSTHDDMPFNVDVLRASRSQLLRAYLSECYVEFLDATWRSPGATRSSL